MKSIYLQWKEHILSLAKKVFASILFLQLSAQSNSQMSQDTIIINPDTIIANSNDFIYHFNKLNTVVKINPKDTIYYCCSGSILYMEFATKISAKADGTFLGKLFFTKSEFARWRICGIKKGSIK